jgi:hypothetical protein
LFAEDGFADRLHLKVSELICKRYIIIIEMAELAN